MEVLECAGGCLLHLEFLWEVGEGGVLGGAQGGNDMAWQFEVVEGCARNARMRCVLRGCARFGKGALLWGACLKQGAVQCGHKLYHGFMGVACCNGGGMFVEVLELCLTHFQPLWVAVGVLVEAHWHGWWWWGLGRLGAQGDGHANGSVRVGVLIGLPGG